MQCIMLFSIPGECNHILQIYETFRQFQRSQNLSQGKYELDFLQSHETMMGSLI